MIFTDHNVFPDRVLIEMRKRILEYTDDMWDRYDNPFEQKSVLKKPYSNDVESLVRGLNVYLPSAMQLTGKQLSLDYSNHYTAVFKYKEGDYLKFHLDAQRHPDSGREKAVTVLLYISTENLQGGELQFLGGNDKNPVYTRVRAPAIFNTVVMFDNQWHGNPLPIVSGTKLVVTVSFLGKKLDIGNERAFFAPAPWDVWDSEMLKHRDMRVDSQHYAEAYRP